MTEPQQPSSPQPSSSQEPSSPQPAVVPVDAELVLWSSPPRDLGERPLLVLLHGYGSHEGDLFQLSPYLPLDAAVASLRAPLATDIGGHSWFSLGERWEGQTVRFDPDTEAAHAAARGVLAWLDSLDHTGPVALLGFSQGGALALQVLRQAPERVAGAVVLAAFVASASDPGDHYLRRVRPPVFWGRGTADEIVPTAVVEGTRAWMLAHVELVERIYEGVGHEVSEEELRDVSAFLRDLLGS